MQNVINQYPLSCPLDAERANKLIEAIKERDERIEKLKDRAWDVVRNAHLHTCKPHDETQVSHAHKILSDFLKDLKDLEGGD